MMGKHTPEKWEFDPERFTIAEPSCNLCTSGSTPASFDKGPCAYHRAITALKQAEGRDA